MRIRFAVVIAAAASFCALLAAASPVEANCGYNPCYNRGQYGYGYQYAQPQYQQQYYYQPQQPVYYQQPVYQQPVYQPPVYQQPYYPPVNYARPCCETNFWDKLFNNNGCCAQSYAQPSYVAPEPPRQEWKHDWNSDWSWSGRRDINIVNHGPMYVTPNNVSVAQEGFGVNYALANPGFGTQEYVSQQPMIEETYVQPVPRARFHRKHERRLDHMSRAAFSKAYPNAVIRKTYAPSRPHYVKMRPRPHAAWAPGNPSTSASSYEVAPRKVLRD